MKNSVLHMNITPSIILKSRLKTPKSIIEKLERKQVPLTEESVQEYVQDIAGVRVICNYIEDTFTIADLLIEQSDIALVFRKRDYIHCPKENGYRSLHLLVSVPVFLSQGTECPCRSANSHHCHGFLV